MREVFALAVEKTNEANALDVLLEKHELWRVLRVGAWVIRFLRNTRTNHKNRVVGPLTCAELCEVVLDVEIAFNNRPLCYLKDDIQLQVLTPNSLLFLRTNQLRELEPHRLEEVDLRWRAKYLLKCKQAWWSGWTNEYLRGLRERHRMKHNGQTKALANGVVVIIKDEERNRNKWKMEIVEELISGRDGVFRAAKLRAGKRTPERAVQHLYPLELTCDRENVIEELTTSSP